MSEKKLRAMVRGYWHLLDGLGVLGFRGGPETAMVIEKIEEALALDPDVVELTKGLIENCLLVDEFGDEWITLERQALDEILQERFRVRLTNDGSWEYLESEEA